jgi:hypothetical protein
MILAEQSARGIWHVVRGDRYACGAKLMKTHHGQQPAHSVPSGHRCCRVGCWNDFDEARAEAERDSLQRRMLERDLERSLDALHGKIPGNRNGDGR